MTESVANARHCYCKPGETTCGTCDRCGQPGHIGHFPGPVPYTGTWCDRCYRVVGMRHTVLRYGIPLAVVLGVAFLARWCSR